MSKLLSPNENFDNLLGYEKIIQYFQNCQEQNKLHHAWLFSGTKGIGKASLCYKLADFLLKSETSSTKIKNLSHPDLMTVKKEEGKKEINIASARKINEFLRLTPAESKYKIVIINAVDEMNINAANSILKLLEEPPKNSIFLLCCHNIDNILLTIKSRCKIIKFLPLPIEATKTIIKQQNPEINEEKIELLINFFKLSPGRALAFCADGGLEIFENLLKFFDHKGNLRDVAFLLNDKGRISNEQFNCYFLIFSLLLDHALKRLVNSDNSYKNPIAEALIASIAANNNIEKIGQLVSYLNEYADKTKRLNLDKNHFILNYLQKLNG